jgi:hypothetical protein
MTDPVIAELDLYREQIEALLALRSAVVENVGAIS